MVKACIGLGSNLGDRRENILQAWFRLGQMKNIQLQAISSPYRSAPVGMESSHWFINAVGSFLTSLQPEQLLAEMFAIEESLGRKRSPGKSLPEDRTVDLDLLYWDDRINLEPDLTLPHPEIARRLFVLLPLAEVEPELIHPANRKTATEMLQELMTGQSRDADELVQKTSWATVKK